MNPSDFSIDSNDLHLKNHHHHDGEPKTITDHPSLMLSSLTSGTAFSAPITSSHHSTKQQHQHARFDHLSPKFSKTIKKKKNNNNNHISLLESSISNSSSSSTSNSKSGSEAQLLFLGYKQELSRTWDFWAACSISFCDMAPLIVCFVSLGNTLVMGGPVIMTWGFLISGIMVISMNAIFAELSSAFPVAGAMVSWSFKLVRGNSRIRDWARPISWVIASALCAAHILVHSMMAREFSNILMQALISSGYHLHLTDSRQIALGFLYIAFCGLLAMSPFAHSAKFWKASALMILGFNLSICLIILITSKHWRPLKTLFTQFINHHPHHLPDPWVLLYAWCRSSIVMSSEPAAHMAEETKDAASSIPKAMFWSNVFSLGVSLFSSICLTLALPPVPHPPKPISPLTSVLFVLCPLRVAQFSVTGLLITSAMMDTAQFVGTSRFFWSMARDKAIPYAKFWRKVDPIKRRPIRSLWLMLFASLMVFSLIFEKTHVMLKVIGDSASFMIVFVYISTLVLYLMSDSDVLVRDGRNVWTLGRFSRPLALLVTLWLLFVFGIMLIPETLRTTARGWTWSPVTIPGIIGLSLLSWLIYGRSHYVGPVNSMTVWTIGQEVEIPKRVHQAVQLPKPNHHHHNQDPNQNGNRSKMPSGTQIVDHRSGAHIIGTGGEERTRTFDGPHTFQTYDSNGSMWNPPSFNQEQATFQSSIFT